MEDVRELKSLIDECIIEIAHDTTEESEGRYSRMKDSLRMMYSGIENGSYPTDYNVIPQFSYIDRHRDRESIYIILCKIDAWYIHNYRNTAKN